MEGMIYSLATGFFWAVAVILYKVSGEVFSAFALNLYKCAVTLVIMVITLLACNIPLFPETVAEDWIRLSISGILGISLADLFFFEALRRLGAGLMGVVECIYLPSVIFLSFIFLNEQIGGTVLMGGALVVSAVIMGSWSRDKTDIPLRDLVVGLSCGITAVLLIAVGVVIIKDTLGHTNVLWATFVRLLAGTAILILMMLFSPKREKILRELYPSKAWVTAFPAAVTGNYLALIFWLLGMKHASISVASILNQMSTVFIFILAAVFLKERITPARTASIVLAVSGAVMAIVH